MKQYDGYVQSSGRTQTIVVTAVGIIFCTLIICMVYFTFTYNALTKSQQQVSATWADVEINYQRRTDLIPNLVSTVKGYATHEKTTFEHIAELRSRLSSFSLSATNVAGSVELQKQFMAIQGELSTSLTRLIAVKESYPELKANQNFMALQDELAGTENRIAVSRKRNQDAVLSYNSAVQTFPRMIIAAITGFKPKPYFQASSSANPEVNFK